MFEGQLIKLSDNIDWVGEVISFKFPDTVLVKWVIVPEGLYKAHGLLNTLAYHLVKPLTEDEQALIALARLCK